MKQLLYSNMCFSSKEVICNSGFHVKSSASYFYSLSWICSFSLFLQYIYFSVQYLITAKVKISSAVQEKLIGTSFPNLPLVLLSACSDLILTLFLPDVMIKEFDCLVDQEFINCTHNSEHGTLWTCSWEMLLLSLCLDFLHLEIVTEGFWKTCRGPI